MDFVTGLPPSMLRGVVYNAILVIVDRYTKMAHYQACTKELDAEGLCGLIIERVIRDYGVPEGIVTDRGSVFTSSYWSNICYYLKMKKKLSTAFHPQTDGQTERQNQTLEAYLRAYCGEEKNDWAALLPIAEFAYNNSKHASTGISPFQALSGYDPCIPPMTKTELTKGDVPAAKERIKKIHNARAVLSRHLAAASLSQKKHYDKRHTPKQFAVDEWVLLSSKNIRFRAGKLTPPFISPFKIIDLIGNQAYKLDLPPLYSRLHPVFHVSLLEKYQGRPGEEPGQWTLPELEEGGTEEEWEIEAIVDSRRRATGTQYLVRWKDLPKEYDEWVHEELIGNATKLLDKYRAASKPDSRRRKRNDT